MKNITFLLFLSLLFPLGGFSQALLNKNALQVNILMEQSQMKETSKMRSSEIFITQVGDQNHVYSSVTIQQNSAQYYHQRGQQNVFVTDAEVNSIKTSVIQHGDRNFGFDFARDPYNDLQLDLVQTGNGHHFERHGSNSIGDRMKFRMEGTSKAIIVRNFK